MAETKNVFISHHHKDDADVDKLTDLLRKNGYNIRNSSIRAHMQGKKIVGVYENGLKDKVELPPALEKYGTSQVVGWDSESIISAIEGEPSFQNPDGTHSPRKDGPRTIC